MLSTSLALSSGRRRTEGLRSASRLRAKRVLHRWDMEGNFLRGLFTSPSCVPVGAPKDWREQHARHLVAFVDVPEVTSATEDCPIASVTSPLAAHRGILTAWQVQMALATRGRRGWKKSAEVPCADLLTARATWMKAEE